MSNIDKIRIILPKGEALEACTEACQESLGIEIPEFDGMTLSAETQDASVFWLKPRDIPGLIARGMGDVGFAGTDTVLEYGDLGTKSRKVAAQQMCEFALLALGEEGREEFERLMNADVRGAGLTAIPTGLPNALLKVASFKDLPVMPYGGRDFVISGSVEAYARLTGSIGVADLVQTGATAEANGLINVERLFDVYPEQIERAA